MRDTDLYAKILGVTSPWHVTDVELEASKGTVTVRVGRDSQEAVNCPHCATASPGYDSRERRWRHLDTCQFKTVLVAYVPRVNCE